MAAVLSVNKELLVRLVTALSEADSDVFRILHSVYTKYYFLQQHAIACLSYKYITLSYNSVQGAIKLQEESNPTSDYSHPRIRLSIIKDCNAELLSNVNSENTDTLTPTFQPWVEHNLIGKRIRLAGCNGRYVIFVSIDDCYNLHRCSLQIRAHGFYYFCAFYDNVSTFSD